MSAPIYRDYSLVVLERRAKAGVRGIVSERNRFALHIWRAPFARLPLDDIRPSMIRAWAREMEEKQAHDTRGARTLSPATIRRTIALVSATFAQAVEEEFIAINPCVAIKLRPLTDERATKDPWTFLTIDEQRAIAACERIPYADRVAIRFAIGTGLRQGEQFHLELDDVHVDGDEPHVFVRYGSKKKPPKSKKSRRRVPLFGDGLAAAREALELVRSMSNPENVLFPSANGRRRGVGKPLGRRRDENGRWCDGWILAKREAGIVRRFRWHDLRHSAASNLVSGVLGRRWTLEEIQAFLGHSSITMTQRYAHLGETALHSAARETVAARPVEAADQDPGPASVLRAIVKATARGLVRAMERSGS